MSPKKKPRRKRTGFEKANLIRIPGGLILVYFSIVALFSSIGGFQWSFVHVVILLLSIVVAAIFIPVGLVLAFGWLPLRLRSKRAPKSQSNKTEV